MLTPDESPVVFAKTFLGLTPHPTQIQWLESRSPVKVACCGRRWGKSFAEAVDLIWFACSKPKTTQFVFAPSADQANVIMEYLETTLSDSPAQRFVVRSKSGGVLKESPFPEVNFINGSSIHARTIGTTGALRRGRGADRLIVDEAAYVPDDALRAAIGPMLATSPYAERVYISTPFGLNHFKDLYDKGDPTNPLREDGFLSFHFPTSSSPYISPSFLEGERRQMTQLEYSIEYEAVFTESQNAVFPWSLIQSCIADTTAPAQPGRRYVLGWDPAQYTDRSGVVVLDVTERPWRVVRCFDISGRDYPEQEREIKKVYEEFGRPKVLLDSTTHAPVLQHLKEAGVAAEGFTFTNMSKRELVDGLVLQMEGDGLRIPPHHDLIEEMKYFRYEMTSAGNVRFSHDEKHHDDLVFALALAVMAANMQPRFHTMGRTAVGGSRPILDVPVR